ncbi:hypothetical protein ACFY8W_18210 [Streptomyces sp. NPDC012637]|uniref:hypothetical protein n=1 Tax=Streptomyces sp. NPDC012637 TaxID=3364842 RepID=UPI0036F13288
MRIARRTLRTAAIATGTVAALSLPAAAFADDSPAPHGDQQVTQDRTQDQAQDRAQDRGQDRTSPGTGDQEQGNPDRGDQGRQDTSDPVVGRIFVQSYKLADGSVAKVYMTTPQDYQAEIWAGGTLLDTLTTSGRPAYGENNGLHVVLNPDGTVRSWTDEVPTPKPDPKPTPKPGPKPTPKPAPKPKPTPKPAPKPRPAPHQADARVTLPDGEVARLYKKGPRVELRFGSLTPEHRTLNHKGWTYKLVPQGKGAYRFVVIDTPRQGGDSWVYDFDGRLVREYAAQKKSTVVVPRGTVPKGAVKAGAENVSDGTHEAALIGAGGGMAALGAAGLGFALFQRRSRRS